MSADAFEAHLREHPDDIAGWSAYADFLTEQGDPRGEFMRVQLALENDSLTKRERTALKREEQTLLKTHEREWLGELAPFVLDAEPVYRDIRRITYRFHRGWLSELRFRYLSVAEARAFARSPQASMLQKLAVECPEVESPIGTTLQHVDSYYEPGPDIPANVDPWDRPAMLALAKAPHLKGVRMFRLGEGPDSMQAPAEDFGQNHTNGRFLPQIVQQLGRVEELYLYAHDVQPKQVFAAKMPHLRVLVCEHERDYPLEVLAKNASLKCLTHLQCHPHAQRPEDREAYIRLPQLQAICRSKRLPSLTHLRLRLTDFGDEGVRELVDSGMLGRLRELDLMYGCITDTGAQLLASSEQFRTLQKLDVTMNAIGKAGAKALSKKSVEVILANQHEEHPDTMEEDGYLDYLCYGDME